MSWSESALIKFTDTSYSSGFLEPVIAGTAFSIICTRIFSPVLIVTLTLNSLFCRVSGPVKPKQ